MPLWFKIVLAGTILSCAGFLAVQIRALRLKRRNLKHWEKNEPLEGGVDRWD